MTSKNSAYQWYQEQWGIPTTDDQQLFLLLTIGTFQAGLSWKVAASKREVFFKYFHEMRIHEVAAMLPDEIEALAHNPEMIRNPRKIQATVTNARAILAIQQEFGSFSNYLWSFVNDCPQVKVYEERYEIPTRSDTAIRVANDLKKRGFSFVGPITTQMFLKAAGLIQENVLNQETN